MRAAVAGKLGWVRRSQKAFQQQEREPEREFVTGEGHYVAGQRRRLVVVEIDERPQVRLREMRVRPETSRNERARLLADWYRRRLRDQVSPLLDRWQPLVGVPLAAWGIRRMKTRWGSCNTRRRWILLNLELAKKSPGCVEYVLVHELVHLLEPDHGSAFQRHMNQLLPQWRLLRDELQFAPLAHESWTH